MRSNQKNKLPSLSLEAAEYFCVRHIKSQMQKKFAWVLMHSNENQKSNFWLKKRFSDWTWIVGQNGQTRLIKKSQFFSKRCTFQPKNEILLSKNELLTKMIQSIIFIFWPKSLRSTEFDVTMLGGTTSGMSNNFPIDTGPAFLGKVANPLWLILQLKHFKSFYK